MKTFRRGDTLDEVDLFRSTRHEADSVADPTGPPAAASVRRGAGLAGIVAGLLIAPSAGAIEFRVESQTLGDAYQLVTSGNEVLNRNRLHQLLGLSLYDLDRERGTIVVRQGKGKKDRMVPVGERALAWMGKYLGEVRPTILLEPDDGTLFLTHEG